ncbi:hypothetical protein ACFSL6_24930 [Paenibacillus thailandensis]|uniref:HK97 gp10 family phage protein n=1 Tax=Paenibacillus thailandensis TaxID=393250 RepID=A0ABW5R3L5_9BACL
MANDGFDSDELNEFADDLLQLAEKTMPKETRKFLLKEGNKLKKRVTKEAELAVEEHTGDYIAGVRRGKVYKYDGDQSIRVYGAASHSNLVEYGHRQVTEDGREVGFVKGKFVFQAAYDDFADTYENDVEAFIDDLLDKGLH